MTRANAGHPYQRSVVDEFRETGQKVVPFKSCVLHGVCEVGSKVDCATPDSGAGKDGLPVNPLVASLGQKLPWWGGQLVHTNYEGQP